jgi:hypothetical protein
MHLQSAAPYRVSVGLEGVGPAEGSSVVIERQYGGRPRAISRPARPACLVPGCTCKDARIVSHRRAAFFAAWAKDHGETADRIVPPDPGWIMSFLRSTD